ncbi:MAG TPA: CPBP family glutamic-type intramembrane protease [Leptolyngbyaceae cyanobacterium]
MTETTPRQGQFWKPFWALFGLGFLGIAALPLILLPQLQQLIPADRTEFSPEGLVVLSLIQPLVLLAIATAVGVKLAPILGFRSYLAEAALQGRLALKSLLPEIPLAVGAGVLFAGIALVSDSFILPKLGEAAQILSITSDRTWGMTLGAILYGGITEELLMRWGLLSLLAWLGWRLFQRQRPVGSGVIWGAILLAALLFGLGHLPLALARVPFTSWLLARTLILNGLGGIIFGWLYWKRSLEAAIIAHASTHVAFSAIAAFL